MNNYVNGQMSIIKYSHILIQVKLLSYNVDDLIVWWTYWIKFMKSSWSLIHEENIKKKKIKKWKWEICPYMIYKTWIQHVFEYNFPFATKLGTKTNGISYLLSCSCFMVHCSGMDRFGFELWVDLLKQI